MNKDEPGYDKATGEMTHKSRERALKYGEVFTPSWVVNMMCDQLEENCGCDPFAIEKTFLEPSCGTGNFLVEILRRKLSRCKTDTECLETLGNIYGIDILPDNVAESKERMLEIFTEHCDRTAEAQKILDKNIILGDFFKIAKDLQNGKGWPAGMVRATPDGLKAVT